MKKVSMAKIIKENGLPKSTVFDGYILQRVDTDEFLSIIDEEDGYSCGFFWAKIPNAAKRFTQPHEPIAIAKKYPDKCMIVSIMFDIGSDNCVIPAFVDKHLESMVSAIYG